MRYDALLIIDMQTALVNAHPFHEKETIERINELSETCRKNKIPVIYVRHDDGEGEELEFGSDGWQIHESLAPNTGEKIFEKRFNSAFRQTGLHEYLREIGAKNLLLCGMQTEYCIDASIKVAFEYEYGITVPRGATTTFDNEFAKGEELLNYYENRIWNNRYAKIVSVETIRKEINSYK